MFDIIQRTNFGSYIFQIGSFSQTYRNFIWWEFFQRQHQQIISQQSIKRSGEFTYF